MKAKVLRNGFLAATAFLYTVVSVSVNAQSIEPSGIAFFQGSWEDALARAESEKKMVFVDVYTEWCGPCKSMDQHVFPQAVVGEVYNSHFVSIKLDAEKGKGVELAKRYGVQAYPTFLYLDAQGYVIDKVVGEQNVQGIIRLAQTALAREGSLLREWEAQYLDGDRDLKFLRKYQELLRSKQLDNTAVLDAYYRLLPQEQLKEEATSIYLSKVMMNTHSVAFVQLMQHYPELSPAARKALAPALFALTVRKGAASALVDGKWVEYAHLRMLGDQLEGLNEKDQEFLLRLDLRYAVQTRSYGVLKRAGYALAEPAFALPESVVQEENVRLYAEAMEPFLSGKRDSTTVVGFAEEQMFARQLKTMEVTEKMHLVAQLFASLPSNETAALKDAVRWIKRCIALYPSNAAFPLVLEKLQAKL